MVLNVWGVGQSTTSGSIMKVTLITASYYMLAWEIKDLVTKLETDVWYNSMLGDTNLPGSSLVLLVHFVGGSHERIG
jgi:hypothetical protein